VHGRDEEDPSVRRKSIDFASLKEELSAGSGLPPQTSDQCKNELAAKEVGRKGARPGSALAGLHWSTFSLVVRAAWPNPSFKPSPNGKTPGPRYSACHHLQRGPGVSPLSPA